MKQNRTAIKIVFIVCSYFSERDYNRFGIELLRENGLDVEIWDITPQLASAEYMSIRHVDEYNGSDRVVFTQRRRLVQAVSQLPKNSHIVLFVSYQFNTYFLYRAISRRAISYSVHVSVLAGADSRLDSVKRWLRLSNVWAAPARMHRLLFRFIPHSWLGIKAASAVLQFGEVYRSGSYPISKATTMLRMHSLDYDIYLRMCNEKCENYDRLAVFLDEYLPYHSDNACLAVRRRVSPEKYYMLLRRYFDHIERNYDVDVVIAAHPRSYYADKSDCYGNRKIVRGQTASLVKKSRFVILHQSMAINFAVIFRKPFVIITTDDVNRCLKEDPHPEWLASYFNKRLYNLDMCVADDISSDLIVDEAVYSRFQREYIKTTGSPELQSWQIFANWVKLSL